ncbi:MAG: hypothetical protein HQL56_10365 [Magnetococcales bacterium]|nr:hypothetical protein [Magnetococcales bacterium]
MRTFIYLLLGLLAILALWYGARMLWSLWHPHLETAPSAFSRRVPSLILATLALLLLALATEHLMETRAPLPTRYEPPHMEGDRLIQGRFEYAPPPAKPDSAAGKGPPSPK